MKFNTRKPCYLNESVCKSLGIEDDKQIDVVGTLDATTANAANEEIKIEKQIEDAFKDSKKNVEEFVEMNHNREVKPEGNNDIKRLRLSESLFSDTEIEEIKESVDFGDPTDMGRGASVPTVPDYSKVITEYIKELETADLREANLLKSSLKRFLLQLLDEKQTIENFNAYWAERYPSAINFLDSQIAIFGDGLLFRELMSQEESLVSEERKDLIESPAGVAEPSKKKRVRSANEIKELGNFSSEDLWLAVYDELSAEVDNEGEGKEVNKKLKARRGERYEKVLPVGDSDIQVYATSPDKFDFAKRVADYYGVKYDEPREDKNRSTNSYYKYTMRIHIPQEDLFNWEIR